MKVNVDLTAQVSGLASRGRLMHVKDSTYRVFQAMEMIVCQYFQRGHITILMPGTKAEMHMVLNHYNQ